MSKILAIGELLAAQIGVLIHFRYGMPYRVAQGGAIFLVDDGVDHDEIKVDARYRLLGWIGIALVVIGTFLQIGGLSLAKGPEVEKRHVDVIGNAVCVMQIATGECEEERVRGRASARKSECEEEFEAAPPKDEAAASMACKGGAASVKAMTPERRAEIARTAAAKRWSK